MKDGASKEDTKRSVMYALAIIMENIIKVSIIMASILQAIFLFNKRVHSCIESTLQMEGNWLAGLSLAQIIVAFAHSLWQARLHRALDTIPSPVNKDLDKSTTTWRSTDEKPSGHSILTTSTYQPNRK